MVQTVKVNFSNQIIILSDGTGDFEFPIIWLRDNCQCAQCFDHVTYTRTIDWDSLDFNVQPKLVDFEDDSLKVKWNDDHMSSFPLSWLQERNFTQENVSAYLENFYQQTKKIWGKNDFEKAFESFDYKSVLTDDSILLKWLEALSIRGIALLKNTPSNENEIYKLANRIAFVRKTHFGDHFVVKVKKETSTFAYTPATLQLHTDIPYYHHMPSVNLLHYLVQSKSHGGKNLITDGFFVAEKMRQEFPVYFETLANISVNWVDVGNEEGEKYHYVLRAPVICLDENGKVIRINRSITQRDSFFSENITDVQKWYKAMAKFVDLLRTEAVEFKMAESDFLTFDNTRLVHGRTGYTDSFDNSRTLVGAYIDWDHINSKIRVLKKAQLNRTGDVMTSNQF